MTNLTPQQAFKVMEALRPEFEQWISGNGNDIALRIFRTAGKDKAILDQIDGLFELDGQIRIEQAKVRGNG